VGGVGGRKAVDPFPSAIEIVETVVLFVDDDYVIDCSEPGGAAVKLSAEAVVGQAVRLNMASSATRRQDI
jgi:hypothetical protein